MPHADVVVVGAGLAGLVAAARLAEAGAAVTLVAKGHAGTHWGSGGLDVAAPAGARTPAEGVAQLAALVEPADPNGHPYAFLGQDVEPSIAWLLETLALAGLPYAGTPASAIRRAPTAIGGTRPVAIVPAAQAGALRPWGADEVLVVAGLAGFKDFWPAAMAASLSRATVWGGADRPSDVRAITVDLPGLAGRHNRNAPLLAARFDDPDTRPDDLERIAAGVGRAAAGRVGRVALPAVMGLAHHADVWAALTARLPLEPFEVPLVPPSVPGMRIWRALREHIRSLGGRVQVGDAVARIHVSRGSVTGVEMQAAARTHLVRTGALVLATGGIAGGGLVARADGTLEEPLLGLRVIAPAVDAWLARDGLDPAGHPIDGAGVVVDARLRPLGPGGRPAFPNVAVAGGLLAGQHAVRERCGDGVSIASGWRAASELAAGAAGGPVAHEPVSGRAQA